MITFQRLELLPFTFYEDHLLQEWLRLCVSTFDKQVERMVYRFCEEQEMLEYNMSFLDHHDLTDILTFPGLKNGHQRIDGDILINVDRLVDNASTYRVPPQNEGLRLLSHGLLHLVGLDDKSNDERARMREEEERCIRLFHQIQAV